MPFPPKERALLLRAYQIGPKVVQRLEEAGFDSFTALKKAKADDVCALIAFQRGNSAWCNHPMARLAIRNAIETAKSTDSSRG